MNKFKVSKKEKIIVFGGSFNPLSKAHGDLIHLLINNYKPYRFILLPSSDEFIKEKKHFQDEDIIPLNKRLKILKEFNKRNRKIEIELIEINNPTFKTYDSLMFLKNKYKDSDIYFALGSEKLINLHNRYKINELLKYFKFIVLKRSEVSESTNNLNREEIVLNNKSSFIFFNFKKDLHDISSTKIRELIKNKDYKALNRFTYKYVINELLKD